MEITDLVRVGKSESYKTFVDSEFVCFLQAETIYKYHIKVGSKLTEEQFKQIREESEKLTCWDKALTYVSKCLKTKKQVIDYLKQKGYLEESVNNAVQKLVDYGYVNDETYAKYYINSKMARKGKKLIQMELGQKGISKEIIQSLFDENFDQKQQCLELCTKYMKNKEKTLENKQKLFRHMFSKGFSSEEIQYSINKIFKSDETDWNN